MTKDLRDAIRDLIKAAEEAKCCLDTGYNSQLAIYMDIEEAVRLVRAEINV